jgi:EmrB/QacA subfamily drug resistance transporter
LSDQHAAPISVRPASGLDARRWRALLLLCAAQFTIILDFSIVNVALPSIQQALGFSQPDLQWVVSAYALAFGGFLLLGGRAADLFGRRRVFMGGFVLFAVGSLLGGLAVSEPLMIAARALQGLGGAIVSPAALSMITTTFEEGPARNRALGVFGMMASAGFGAGVLLGGLLTEVASWRSVFFVNVPIAALAVVLAPRWLQERRERAAARSLDLPGAISVTLGLVALVYALAQAPEVGWPSGQTLALIVVALLALTGFVAIESRTNAPLVPLRIFRSRAVTAANLVSVLVVMAIPTHIFIVTLYMQDVLGYSAIQTGLAWLPHAVAAFVAGLVVDRIAARVGVKAVVVLGIVVLAAGLLLLGQIRPGSGYLDGVLPGTIVTALGIVLAFVSLTITATAGVQASEQGLASGLLSTAQQVGVALGMAVVVGISTARSTGLTLAGVEASVAAVEGFRYALAAGAGIAILSALIAGFGLRDARHAPGASAPAPSPAREGLTRVSAARSFVSDI